MLNGLFKKENLKYSAEINFKKSELYFIPSLIFSSLTIVRGRGRPNYENMFPFSMCPASIDVALNHPLLLDPNQKYQWRDQNNRRRYFRNLGNLVCNSKAPPIL